jgi:hypothetical protein
VECRTNKNTYKQYYEKQVTLRGGHIQRGKIKEGSYKGEYG